MKKIIIIAVVAALVLSLGVTAYAVNNNRTSQPDTTQGEQFPAEAPQMDGEKPSGDERSAAPDERRKAFRTSGYDRL